MGIRDLLPWIKRTHPAVFTTYPKRWASPELKGKKIAIDGTLLTNRFHFAIQEGPLKGKGGLVGWFNLINVLRKSGIKPVAIWDERGPRDWKAPEAARRLAARALNLSRRSHEDDRYDRLLQWKQAFLEVDSLPSDEKAAVKAHFQGQGQGQGQGSSGTSPSPSSSPQERIAIQEKLETTTDLDMAEIDAALERITTMIDTLSDLQAAYTAKSATGVSRTTPPGLSAALQHVSELERLHEAIGETSRPRDIYRSPQEEEEISVLDEALEQVVPEEAFRESRRQRSLTEEEGRFINQLLGVPTPAGLDTEKHGLDGMLADRDGGHVEIPPMGRLDDLIQTSPEVKATYQRALNNPTAADHDACRELVMRMGVPVLEAAIPYEAEGLAASLANAGLVDFVGSEDSDVIAYEAPLLRNVSSATKPLVLVSSKELRFMTALSPSAFLDFCILLGTDASPRIPTVGPTRAYKLIHKYGSIEEIMAKEPKYRERAESIEGFMEMVKSARKVFGRAPPIPEGLSLEQGKYDAKIVEAWLRDAHGVEFVYQDQMESEESSDGQVWAVDDDVDEMPVGRETWDEEWDATVSDSDSVGSGSR